MNIIVLTQETTAMQKQNNVISCDLPPLDGLDIRLAWGKAKVMRIIDAVKARTEEAEVLTEAQMCGYQDYSVGKHTVPAMFRDEPELVKAWRGGWRLHASTDEMSLCPGCEGGDPCPWHD